jgi:hypothetical protein
MPPITRWPRLLTGVLVVGALAACGSKTNEQDDGPTPPPAPTVSLSASPTTVTLGAATTLTWSSTNATSCVATGAWTGTRGTSGSEASIPDAVGPAAYTLTCSGPGGSASATATVSVTAAPVPAPTVSLSAAPNPLTIGAATTLTWTSTDATSCTASEGWTGSRPTAGTESLTPAATGTALYTLTCTGEGGSTAATASVTVNPVPTLSLTFEGRALSAGGATGDGGLANAAIRVSVGGENFTGTADATGRFSIPVTITASGQDQLVRIFATKPSSPSTVVYVSQLASFRTLLTQAGPDATLSVGENFRVNVSNLATAEAALLQEAALGFPVETSAARPSLRTPAARPLDRIGPSDEELASALLSINQAELLDVAVSLSLVADRGFALPDGVDTTLELALAPDARQRFIDGVRNGTNAVQADETLNSLLGNRAAVVGATTASVPREAVAAVTGTATEENLIGNGGGAGGGIGFRFRADGSGTYTDSTYASDASNWTVSAAGVIEVRFAAPPSFSFDQFVDDPTDPSGFRLVTCTQSLTAVDVRPISGSTARINSTESLACPDAPELDQQFNSAATLLFVAPSALPPITAADLAGKTLGLQVPVPADAANPDGPFALPGDLLSFDANGTGSTRAQPLTFTWALASDGALVVSLSNGLVARFRKLREVVSGIDLYYSEYTSRDVRRAGQQPAFQANDGLRFTPTGVVGTHYNGGVGSIFPLESVQDAQTARLATQQEVNLLKGFAIEIFENGRFSQQVDRLRLDANGQAIREFFPMNSADRGRYWRIMPDGGLVFRQYFRVTPETFEVGTGCGFDGGSDGCVLSSERIVEPCFLHGNRQGWFERLRSFDVFAGELVSEDVRTFFYVQRASGDWALPRDNVSPLRQQRRADPSANLHGTAARQAMRLEGAKARARSPRRGVLTH